LNISDEQKVIYGVLIVALIGLGLWSQLSRPPKISQPNLPSPIRLLAVGDINLGRVTGQKILAGDNNYAFEYMAEQLSRPDLTFGNLESQLADLGGETQSPTNEYRFAGPPAGADGLQESGFDIVSIANNHMWDYGKDALFSTIDNLDRVGVKHAGASKNPLDVYQPTIVELKDQKIAFFAVTGLLNGYEKSGALEHVAWADPGKLIPAIEQVKGLVDWVIVSVHWGSEYVESPNQKQVDLAHQLVDAGAQLIIGHHSHVPQGVEEYHDGLILYSLGNFAFWQPMTYWTQNSFIAEITLYPSTGMVEYNPVAVDAGWQPRLATDDDEAKILQHIAQLSKALQK